MEIEDIKKKLSESGWGSKSPSAQQRSFWLGLSRQEERWMPTLKESQIEGQHSSAGAGRKQKEQVEPTHCLAAALIMMGPVGGPGGSAGRFCGCLLGIR
jgi:hypothetical protein